MRNLYAAFVERDMQTMFADVHDDIVYVLHVDPDIIPMGGEHRGKTEFRAVVDGMNESFSYLRFNRSRFRQSGDIVVLRVDYTCLHKATGEIISGAIRPRSRFATGASSASRNSPTPASWKPCSASARRMSPPLGGLAQRFPAGVVPGAPIG